MSLIWNTTKDIKIETNNTRNKIMRGIATAIIWQSVMFLIIWFIIQHSSLR